MSELAMLSDVRRDTRIILKHVELAASTCFRKS